MNSYLEHYPSKQNGVTLHTWTEREGRKEENFYITGLSGPQSPRGFGRNSARSTSPISWTFRRPPVCPSHDSSRVGFQRRIG